MKVTGFIPEGKTQKDFRIEHRGETRIAERRGKLFSSGVFIGTLQQIKLEVKRLIDEDLDGDNLASEVVDDQPCGKASSYWACVEPCALLAMIVDGAVIEGSLRREIMRTLDNHGWIDPETNEINRAAVVKDYEKWSEK